MLNSTQQTENLDQNSNYEISFDNFEKIHVLHERMYGITTLYRDPSNSQMIAVKQLYHSDELSNSNEAFNREVNALIKLRHSCIVPIYGYSSPTATTPPRIATLYASNGSLSNILQKIQNGEAPSFVSDTWLAKTITRLVLGMKYIHSEGWIHRDIKPSNILINDQYLPLIADLGSSRFVHSGATLTHMVGTPLYMAPEMYEEGEYTQKVDVYSFGLVLYELLVGRPVFPRNIQPGPLMRQVLNGTRPEIPDTVIPEMKKIIEDCWDVSPQHRPTFDDIYRKIKLINYKITPNVDSNEVLASIDDIISKVNVKILLWDKQSFNMEIRYDDFVDDIRKKISERTHFPIEEIILGREGKQFAGCCWNCNNFCNFTFENAFTSKNSLRSFLDNPVIELMMQVYATVKNYPSMPGQKHDGNTSFFFVRPTNCKGLIEKLQTRSLWFTSDCHCKYIINDTDISMSNDLVFNIAHKPIFSVDVYFQWDCKVCINSIMVDCNLDDPARELLWRFILMAGKKIEKIPYLTKIGQKIDLNKTLRQSKIINYDVLRCNDYDSDHSVSINIEGRLFLPPNLPVNEIPMFILLATRNWAGIRSMNLNSSEGAINKYSDETVAEAGLIRSTFIHYNSYTSFEY